MSTQAPVQPRERIDNIVLVDMSEDARDAARDAADTRLAQELQSGGRFKRVVKSVWKGNIAKEYYRQRYIREAHEGIVETQDVLTHELAGEGDAAAARHRSMAATIERFQSEYDEAIHTEAGEQRETLNENSELTQEVKELIRQYTDGQLDDASLREEFSRTIAVYREHNGAELKGAGIVQLSNMIEVARQVRSAVSHGEALDEVMREFSVVSGESRVGVRTAAKYDRVEKIIDKVQSSRVGSLISSDAVVAGVSIAASLARFGSEKVVGAAAKTLGIGVGAGVLGALRERKRVTDERVQHAREMAQGKEFSAGSKRREEMEQTRYHTVNARELADQLRTVSNAEQLDQGGSAALQLVLDELTKAEALIGMSDQRSIDLLSFSDTASVAEERFELDVARAQAKVALRDRLDIQARQALGLGEEDVSQLIDSRATVYIDMIDNDIGIKDEAFKKLRRRRMAVAGARSAALGVVFGLAAQEGIAALSGSRAGAVESLWGAQNTPAPDGMQHNTILNSLVHGETQVLHHDPSANFTDYKIGNGQIQLPDDYKFIDHSDGTASIVGPDGNPTISSLPIEKDGSLSAHALSILQSHGVGVDNLTKTTSTTQDIDIHDYLQGSDNATTQIERELWYDNDTPAPNFDRNELGMSWGGEGNSGITGDGSYTFNVSGMQADGSYHGTEGTDWAHNAQEGTLKVAISATRDTQSQVFMLDVKPNGEMIVPKDSPAAALFATENGHAVFKGAYAETVQVTGSDNGITHVRPLATVVGDNDPGKIPIVTTVEEPSYKLTPSGYDTVKPVFTEMAPVIPIDGRRSLEVAARRRTGERRPFGTPSRPEQYYYTSQYGSYEQLESTLHELDVHASPRLNSDPSVRLNTGEEIMWFGDTMRADPASAEYMTDIENQIQRSPELSGVDGQLESIITIPVKASGKEESESIYNLLATYAKQDPDALSRNLMLLHVNWPEAAESDVENLARIQRTLAEIERARSDFPGLKIARVESKWSQADLEGGVIGRVADKMRDSALLAIEKAIREGRMASDHEVQIIRNDADAKGIHRNYLAQLQKALREYPDTDVFTGLTRFDQRRASELPGMVAGQNFASMVDILETGRQGKVHTGGANFGIRASTLAAVAPLLLSRGEKGVGSDDVAVGRIISAARGRNLHYSANSHMRNGQQGMRTNMYYYEPPINRNLDRMVARRVGGAQIDTDSQRSEEVYLMGGNFHNTWDAGFDNDGHRERGSNSDSKSFADRRSELASDMDAQTLHLERDVIHTIKISGGFANPAVQTALITIFAGLKGHPGYKVVGDNIEFTSEGHQHIKQRLQRDARGRFDRYGSRLARQLYGEVKVNARRRPVASPLISVN